MDLSVVGLAWFVGYDLQTAAVSHLYWLRMLHVTLFRVLCLVFHGPLTDTTFFSLNDDIVLVLQVQGVLQVEATIAGG